MKVIKSSLLLLFFSFLSHGYYRSAAIWHKKDAAGKDQYVIPLGDIHEKDDIGRQHAKALATIIKQRCGTDKTLVISEDMAEALIESDPKLKNISRAKIPLEQKGCCSIACVTERYAREGIKTKNAEFRLYSTDLLRYYKKTCSAGTCNIDYGYVLPELQKVMESNIAARHQTLHYDDGPILNEFYTKCRKAMDNSQNELLKAIKFLATGQSFSIDLGYHLDFSIAAELDIRIMHIVHENPDTPFIFICVGDWHKDDIETVLPELGYTKIHSDTTKDYWFGKNAPLELTQFFDTCPGGIFKKTIACASSSDNFRDSVSHKQAILGSMGIFANLFHNRYGNPFYTRYPNALRQRVQRPYAPNIFRISRMPRYIPKIGAGLAFAAGYSLWKRK